MAKVDMQLLKQIREATLAPLKDCKDALIEANGDYDKALQILKEKGAMKASKKKDRETKEGLVKGYDEGDKVVVVKVLCETDFVSRNEEFQKLLDEIKEVVKGLEVESYENLSNSDLKGKLEEMVNEYIGKLGENIKIGDVFVKDKDGLDYYVYNHPGNKIVAMVGYKNGNSDVAKEIALQVAAMEPMFISKEDVDSNYIEELKSLAMKDDRLDGKPEEVKQKIIEGKVSKMLEDVVLLEQKYIRDQAKKIKEILPAGMEVVFMKRFSI